MDSTQFYRLVQEFTAKDTTPSGFKRKRTNQCSRGQRPGCTAAIAFLEAAHFAALSVASLQGRQRMKEKFLMLLTMAAALGDIGLLFILYASHLICDDPFITVAAARCCDAICNVPKKQKKP